MKYSRHVRSAGIRILRRFLCLHAGTWQIGGEWQRVVVELRLVHHQYHGSKYSQSPVDCQGV